MLETGAPSVSLDMRAVDPAHFPNVVSVLRRAGLDPARELIPVAPAAHYMMGGIATDLDGRSSLPALYAVGECACTGLHGANRLASNSLSECFVFGRRAALAALDEPALTSVPAAAGVHSPAETDGGEPRGALARRGDRARRRRTAPAARRSAPDRAAGRGERPGARGEPRRPSAARLPGGRLRPRRPPHGRHERRCDVARVLALTSPVTTADERARSASLPLTPCQANANVSS